MLARDFMTKNVVTASEETTVQEAASTMWENGYSVLPVVDKNGSLIGLMTESNFFGKEIEIPHALGSIKGLLGEMYQSFGEIESIFAKAKTKPLSEVMSRNIQAVPADATLNQVVNKMTNCEVKKLPVVENGKLIGLITRKDVIKAFLKI